MVKAACLKSRRSWVRIPLWHSNFKKIIFLRSLVKIEYCGEPPWPRGSVLSLRPPGLECPILCLEGSVIPFIMFREVILAKFGLHAHKGGLKPHFFHLLQYVGFREACRHVSKYTLLIRYLFYFTIFRSQFVIVVTLNCHRWWNIQTIVQNLNKSQNNYKKISVCFALRRKYYCTSVLN